MDARVVDHEVRVNVAKGIVGDFERILKAPVLLLGFGLPGENAHAPDEWLSVENFEKGMRTAAALWNELGKSG
ncbi:MAG TPA: M20/M25/M40 family metallo-hydrolase [Thermoanaerobaculia bacterium]|nr:M20/M25/M40 family metallo-hydrolase [Thermoanaerobaculia bacterium]